MKHKKEIIFSIDFCDEKDYVYKALYENALVSWSDKIYYTKNFRLCKFGCFNWKILRRYRNL